MFYDKIWVVEIKINNRWLAVAEYGQIAASATRNDAREKLHMFKDEYPELKFRLVKYQSRGK